MIPFQGLIASILGVIGLIVNWNKEFYFFFWLLVFLLLMDMVLTDALRNVLKIKGDCNTARITALIGTINQMTIMIFGIGSFST